MRADFYLIYGYLLLKCHAAIHTYVCYEKIQNGKNQALTDILNTKNII